ncbi:MAG: hypothetical protein WCV71_03280 [Patescibacteria group bacterium]
MFDDLKQDNNQNVSSPSGNTNQGGIPPSGQNSKASSVDDMFGDIDPVAASHGPVDPNKPSAVQLGKIRPVSQTTVPTPQMTSSQIVPAPAPQRMAMPSIASDNSMVVRDDRSGGAMRKIIIAILVIVLLAIVGGGIYYFFLRGNNIKLDSNQNKNIDTNVVVNENVNNNINTEPAINEDDLDDDFDGLSNGLEKIYGTNPLESDTDNDGVFDQDEVELYNTDPLIDDSDSDALSDHEEIIIYKTDPNNPDSDGDTYQDGAEVTNGYNPLGNGKLSTTTVSNLNTNEAL